MPSISGTRPQPTAQPPTGRQAPANQRPNAAAQSGQTPAAATPSAAARASVGNATKASKKVSINGLKGLESLDTFGIGRGQSAVGEFTPVADEGPAERGYIECSAQPTTDGCRLTVNTYHKEANENLSLILQAEVLDMTSNELRGINLAVLAKEANLNQDGYRGKAVFDVSYDDINAYLQKHNPNLKVTPGSTKLAVAAIWHGSTGHVQHRAGGMARGGAFRLPALPGGAANAVATRVGQLNRAPKDEPDLPLDMAVSYPTELTDKFEQLQPDGSVVSRLESEFKGSTDKKSMTRAIRRMYELAASVEEGNTAEVENIFGSGWTIETVKRYWLQDDGSDNQPGQPGSGFFAGYRVDDDGLPIQDPMRDRYMDNGDLSMTALEGAIRLRRNKQATQINVKPGAGRLDAKTGIRQRVEVGVDLKPDASVAEASEFLEGVAEDDDWRTTVFNQAGNEVRKLDDSLKLAEALDPWLQVTQDRHKFTLRNKNTGVETEFSFDKVQAQTLRPEHGERDGSPRQATFYVLEGELNHLQLSSENQSDYKAAGADTSLFDTDDAQTEWLENTSESVTMDIEPRLHTLEDLENESFRQTASYRAFEDINTALKEELFPKGFAPAKQKAAHAAEVLGLVPLTQQVAVDQAYRAVTEAGLAWSDEVADVVKEFAQQKGPEALAKHVAEMADQGIVSGLQQIAGDAMPALRYDADNLERMLAAKVEGLGYRVTPEVRAFLGKLDPETVSADRLQSIVQERTHTTYWATPEPNKILRELAKAHGLDAPKFAPHLDGLLEQQLPEAAQEAWLSDASVDKLKDFYAKAVAKGASIAQVHTSIKNIKNERSSPFEALEKLTGEGSAPELGVDLSRFREKVYEAAKDDFIAPNAALDDFLAQVADKTTAREAKRWASRLRGDLQERFASKATDLGIDPPKSFAYDKDALADWTRQSLRQNDLVFTPEVADYVGKLVDAGNNIYDIKRAVKGLDSKDFAALLQPHDLKAPDDAKPPHVEVDYKKALANTSAMLNKEQKDYLKTNVPKAMQSDDFDARVLLGWSGANMLTAVEKATGVKAP